MKNLFFIFLFIPHIVFSQSTGTWSYVGSPGIDQIGGQNISIAVSPTGIPWFSCFSNGGIPVYKYESEWTSVGYPNLFGFYLEPVIKIGPDNSPYLLYNDENHNGLLSVKKYSGSSWEYVGNPGFSNFPLRNDMAIDPAGQIFVAFIEDYGGRITVKKFNGSSWILLGSTNFGNEDVDDISLAVTQSGTPYVAYRAAASDNKLSVMKFDGSNWVYVGSQGISQGIVLRDFCIAVDSSEVPYVAYSDYWNDYKARVKFFDGNNWNDLGGSGISEGIAEFFSLMIDPQQHPVIGFSDGSHGYRPTALKFDNVWEPVGPPGFTPDSSSYPAFAADQNGKIYCAFWDEAVHGYLSVMVYDSVETGIIESINKKVMIYPNPASNYIHIDLSKTNVETGLIELFDITGKKLKSIGIPERSFAMNISQLQPGLYTLRIVSGNGVRSGRFVKQ